MNYLTFDDRKQIAKMYNEKTMSYRTMGKLLKRSASTIIYEISMNKMSYEKKYDPIVAHRRFMDRQGNKGKVSILSRNQALKRHVINSIVNEKWSPEEIAGDLREKCKRTIICHETIYKFIYSNEGRDLRLWLSLRHKKKSKRESYYGRKSRKETIPDRTPIQVRGEKKFGDLESDSMIFSNQKPILSVQVEAISKRCFLSKLLNKTAEETKNALDNSIAFFGEHIVKSITFDNGTENVLHTKIKEIWEIKTYFCDPYCSWQKGLVENTNKLIRQYLPRWTNMDEVTDEQLYEIQEKLNNRPRKSLGYKTPNQIFSHLTCHSVRI